METLSVILNASQGGDISLSMVAAAIGILVTVGGIILKLGGIIYEIRNLKERIAAQEAEKKKELTEQGQRNNEYQARLIKLEGGMENLLAGVREMKTDIKSLLSRS